MRVPAPEAPSASVPAGWVPPVAPRHWVWIIIHHSDSDYGSAAIIDKWHRDRGFDELGYHFVIGNGTNSGDGQIEVGPRWTKQKWGAHDNALDNRYNIYGIGICLVGDFNKTHPTPRQLHSLVRLVAYLMQTYNISPDHVLGHGQTKVTECPGRNLNVAMVREEAERLVQAGDLDFNAKYADQR
jgi:N-acetylmuramoyl-L-alanine amidase